MGNEKYVDTFESHLDEAIKSKRGQERVNIITGRFQPFHMGHLKIAEDLYKKNGLPIILIKVRKTKESMITEYGKGTLFPYSIIDNMLNEIIKNYDFIIDHIEIENVSFDTQLFPSLRPKYEPVLFGAGPDRVIGYDAQRQRFIDKHDNKLNFDPDFEIEKTNRYGSATVVRDAINKGDKEMFLKLMPESLHKFYDDLKNTKK